MFTAVAFLLLSAQALGAVVRDSSESAQALGAAVITGEASLETRGSEALNRADYQQAEQIFSQLAAADPKDVSARFNLALAETGLKKDEKAIENFRKVLDLQPGLYQAQLNLGMLYLRNQRAAEAEPLFVEAARAKPDDAKPHFYLAESARARQKWQESAGEYAEALKRDPKNARAEIGLGESLLRQGKLVDAQSHYERGVRLDASLKPYLLEYAVALADAGQAAQAVPLLEQFPDDRGARAKLGQIYLQEKQPEKAITEYEAATHLAPTPANKLALATAYLRAGQKDKAEPLLKEALAASPGDWELLMTVGRIERDQKNYPEAAKYFSSAATVKPDAPESWSELAGVLTLQQSYADALAALAKLHELHAEKPGHYFLRAIIFDKLRQPKPALANYQQFLETSNGQNPDQEFQARGRIKALEHEVSGRR